jgi:hypothetical protein
MTVAAGIVEVGFGLTAWAAITTPVESSRATEVNPPQGAFHMSRDSPFEAIEERIGMLFKNRRNG